MLGGNGVKMVLNEVKSTSVPLPPGLKRRGSQTQVQREHARKLLQWEMVSEGITGEHKARFFTAPSPTTSPPPSPVTSPIPRGPLLFPFLEVVQPSYSPPTLLHPPLSEGAAYRHSHTRLQPHRLALSAAPSPSGLAIIPRASCGPRRGGAGERLCPRPCHVLRCCAASPARPAALEGS